MFFIKRLTAVLLAFTILPIFGGCRKEEDDYITSGELVVVHDDTDITLGIYGIDTLNPIATASKSVQKIMNIIYEPLFTVDERETAVPVLAQSYTMSEDGMQMTVNLREDKKWHDGTNFTADDVVYTLSKLMSTDSFYNKAVKKIKSFTAVNKHQVIINFVQSETDFSNCLNFPIISQKTHYTTDNTFVPMGTGAYKYDSGNSTEIVLKPIDENVSKRIKVKILRDKTAAAEAFNVNELDAVTSDEIDLETTAPKNYSQTKTIVSDNMVFMGMNTENPVLNSSGIRRAVNALVNKQKIVDNCAYGNGMVTDMSIKPNAWAYQASENEISQSDIETLFEQEGYVPKNGVYYKNSAPLSMSILVNNNNQKRMGVAESLRADLQSYGISASVQAVDYETYIARINEGNYELFVGETAVDQNLNPSVMLDGDSNYFRFDATELKNAKNKLYGVTDKERYKQGVNAFLKVFNASPPYVPLYFKTESVIYGSYVSGIDAPVLFDSYKNIENWYFYDKNGKENKEQGNE